MKEVVLFTVYSILMLAVTILCVCERWPLLSAVAGLFLGVSLLYLIAFSSGENNDYNYAIIELPDGSIVEGNLDSYGYSNDRIRVTINGTPYEVDSDNCTFFVKKLKQQIIGFK